MKPKNPAELSVKDPKSSDVNLKVQEMPVKRPGENPPPDDDQSMSAGGHSAQDSADYAEDTNISEEENVWYNSEIIRDVSRGVKRRMIIVVVMGMIVVVRVVMVVRVIMGVGMVMSKKSSLFVFSKLSVFSEA